MNDVNGWSEKGDEWKTTAHIPPAQKKDRGEWLTWQSSEWGFILICKELPVYEQSFRG